MIKKFLHALFCPNDQFITPYTRVCDEADFFTQSTIRDTSNRELKVYRDTLVVNITFITKKNIICNRFVSVFYYLFILIVAYLYTSRR